jgi:hypothetical protein
MVISSGGVGRQPDSELREHVDDVRQVTAQQNAKSLT